MKERKKPKYNLFQNIGFMFRTTWKTRKTAIFVAIILSLLRIAADLARLFIAPEILAEVEQAAPISDLLGTIAFFSLALFLLSAADSYIADLSILSINETRLKIRDNIIRKACLTAYPNATDPEFIKVQEDAIDNTDTSRRATGRFWITLEATIVNTAGFVIYLTMLTDLNIFLAIAVLITSFAGFFVTKRLRRWGYNHRKERGKYLRQVNYISEKAESVVLAKDIRIFGLESWLREVQDSAVRAYDAFVNKREGIYRIASLIEAFLVLARNGIAYVYLIHMALTEGLSAAEFLLYFTTVSAFTTKVAGILESYGEMHAHSLELSAIQEFLETPEPFRFEGGKPVPKTDAYELRLENVTFRYPGSEKPLFRNLDLTIRPGENLAVVGLNGAGKTTLVKLLCGFYDPDEGRVLLNGIDIRQFNRQEYYEIFTAVFQEYTLLDATLKENVAQRADGINEALVWDCLEKAGLREMAEKLPAGLETHIGRDVFPDGILLSGGQTQRLMLARALYKGGAVLVLDEPTAALDPIAEDDIYRKYNGMTKGRTSLFISHRLASTRFCDRILFLADGAIAEEGTHESLIKLGGEYAKLFEVQSRYYQEGRDFRHEEI